MDIAYKIVTKLPLESLWTEKEELNFERQNYPNREALNNILKARQPVQFVVANCGSKLEWIPLDKCFETYRKDFKEHIIDDMDKIYLDQLKDNFGYIASVWTDKLNNQVIVLERIH